MARRSRSPSRAGPRPQPSRCCPCSTPRRRSRAPELRHLHGFEWAPNRTRPPELTAWPYTTPAVAQFIAEGRVDIPAGVTFLIGENGSGKSTLVEAFAEVYPREGHLSSMVHGLAGPEASVEDSPLRWNIKAVTDRMASPAGFFLRAESMHTFLGRRGGDDHERRVWGDEPLQERSHGESFLAILRMRFAEVGVYFMDEPEAALSFRSCLGLLSLLDTMRREGSQVIVATHSPLLVSLPGATLLQLDEDGMRQVQDPSQLDLVRSWRDFLEGPERYFRHLFDPIEDEG